MRLAEASSPGTKEDRKDRRVLETQTGKRQVVVVAREHKGRTLTFVVAKEADAVKIIRERVASGTIVHADEAAGRDALHASYDTKRINHSIAYRLDVACANQAESFFARLRRAEMGQAIPPDQRSLPPSLRSRDGLERTSPPDANGTQLNAVTGLALRHPISREWAGYWQRRDASEGRVPELVNKRMLLFAEIQIAERRLTSLRTNLDAVDSRIVSFVIARYDRQEGADRRHGISRAILDTLRQAAAPLTKGEIADRIASARGVNVTKALVREIATALRRRKDSLIVRDGERWQIGK